MTSDFTDRSEFAEREHSLDILVKFLEEVLKRTDTISRITDGKMASILHFYAGLVDRSISVQDIPRETLPGPFLSASPIAGSSKLSITHRRNKSSLSSSSPSSASSPTQNLPPSITASECAIVVLPASCQPAYQIPLPQPSEPHPPSSLSGFGILLCITTSSVSRHAVTKEEHPRGEVVGSLKFALRWSLRYQLHA
jgi:hypothetical protein